MSIVALLLIYTGHAKDAEYHTSLSSTRDLKDTEIVYGFVTCLRIQKNI
jgi:hypothetical protein